MRNVVKQGANHGFPFLSFQKGFVFVGGGGADVGIRPGDGEPVDYGADPHPPLRGPPSPMERAVGNA